MYFELVSEISDVETIAVGGKIRELGRLRQLEPVATLAQDEGICHGPPSQW